MIGSIGNLKKIKPTGVKGGDSDTPKHWIIFPYYPMFPYMTSTKSHILGYMEGKLICHIYSSSRICATLMGRLNSSYPSPVLLSNGLGSHINIGQVVFYCLLKAVYTCCCYFFFVFFIYICDLEKSLTSEVEVEAVSKSRSGLYRDCLGLLPC